MNNIYDVIGVGIGPFNLGLACLLDDKKEINKVFLDSKATFEWHTGIMPDWTTLQIPFIADLVTFADPTSKFSLLNYLKQTGRLYSFYFYENFYLSRAEYNKYCKWVVGNLNSLCFGRRVNLIEYDEQEKIYYLKVEDCQTKEEIFYKTKKLVIGIGTNPIKPKYFAEGQPGTYLVSSYSQVKVDIQRKKSITIVGSGQSGAEIFYDLLKDKKSYGYALNWIGRSSNFYAMDLNKFALELSTPDYKNFFENLPAITRKELLMNQSSLYKGVNRQLLNDIYNYLYNYYDPEVGDINLYPGLDVYDCVALNQNWRVFARSRLSKEKYYFDSEVVIFALGYEYEEPMFLRGIESILNRDDQGNLLISNNYSIDVNNTIFIQNAGIDQHGFLTSDLGLGPYRNSLIANSLLGREAFSVEKKICYQQFL